MKTQFLGIACTFSLLALAPHALAHGGQYVGPGDIVPPGAGGGRPTGPSGPTNPGLVTGGPVGPGAPAPAGPTRPSTGGGTPPPGGRAAGATSGRGFEPEADTVGWDFWWEFNKAPYLALKESLSHSVQTGGDDFFLGGTRQADASDRQQVDAQDVNERVIPALKRALDSAAPNDVDLASSAMVALAKIGRDHTTFRLVEAIEPRLAAANLEVRQTAALALGLAGIPNEHAVDLLVGLAADTSVGRDAVRSARVDEPTRAFAVYGLGLLAHANQKLALQRRTFATVAGLITSDDTSSRNLCVAAIHATSLLRFGTEAEDERLRGEVLDRLEGYYVQRLGAGDELMQAHCATAIAKLIGPHHIRSQHYRDLFVADLSARTGKARRGADIQRACALALGRLGLQFGDADGDDSPAGSVAKALLAAHSDAKDAQTRCFALIALGQIGGEKPRDLLLHVFDKGKVLDRTWSAIALGIHAFHARKDAANREDAERHVELIGRTLSAALREERNPACQGAFAVALGLCGYRPAAPILTEVLAQNAFKDDVAGYCCIGLALMKERSSSPRLLELLDASTRRPRLLQQAVVALGVLGDIAVATRLGILLADGETNLAKLSAIAMGLSFIGDRRSIGGLVATLDDRSHSQLQRAFAAVALGGIADRSPLPWNSPIGIDTNYRANTETLTNQSTGILDIL